MAVRYFDMALSRGNNLPKLDLGGPSKWLRGAQQELARSGQSMAVSTSKDGKPERVYISPEQAATLTEGYLNRVSETAFNFFSDNMPPNYPLPRHNYVNLVDKYPHLGYCSFATVPMKREDGSSFVIRLHYANFMANIDTNPGAPFFNLNSLNRGAMFFGVAFTCDEENPKRVRVDRSVHHSGISFVTTDASKALDNAITLRTGIKPEQWKKLIEERMRKMRAAKAA